MQRMVPGYCCLNNTCLANVLVISQGGCAQQNHHILLAYPKVPLLPKCSKVQLAYMPLSYFKQSEGLCL